MVGRMTNTDRAAESTRGSSRRWLVEFVLIAIPAALVFSLIVVVFAAFYDHDLVRTLAESHRVELGWPLPWLHQDQSGYAWLFPSYLGLASPLENPTTMSLGPFLMDVLIVFAVVMAVVLPAALSVASVRRRLGLPRY